MTGERWHAGHDGDPCQIGTEDGYFVAMTLPCDAGSGTAADYARAVLIAKAPELRDMLSELATLAGEADALQHAGLDVPPKLWGEIYQAGVKARGLLAGLDKEVQTCQQ